MPEQEYHFGRKLGELYGDLFHERPMLSHAGGLGMRTYLIAFALLLVAGAAAASDTTTIEGFLTALDAGTRINWAFGLLHDCTSLNISQLNRKRLSLHGITLLTRKKSCHEGEQPYDYRV